MPVAAVLFLQAQQDGALYGATGQHAHGFWLNSWRSIAAEVGDALHDDRPLRPFTVSPLLGLRNTQRGRTTVTAGNEVRLRLTTIDDQTHGGLLGRWLLQLPPEVNIGGLSWAVRGHALSPLEHPAAGFATYAALRDRYRGGDPVPQQWDLAFETPTAFHLVDHHILPFPLPERLAAGWLRNWQTFSPYPLHRPNGSEPDFLARVKVGLRISRYDLKTVSFRFRHDGPDGRCEVPQIGCIGSATLDGRGLDAADCAAVASLVDFAFYCGSGHHTAMGMGQTNVLAIR